MENKSVTFRDYVEIDEKKMREKIIDGMFCTSFGVILTAIVACASFVVWPLFGVVTGIIGIGSILVIVYFGIASMIREVTESKVIILKINGEDVTPNN